MTESSRHDAWRAGDSYDSYMGRWSRQIAPRFLDWLDRSESWIGWRSAVGPARYPPLSYRDVTQRALSPSIRPKDFLQKPEQTHRINALSFGSETHKP